MTKQVHFRVFTAIFFNLILVQNGFTRTIGTAAAQFLALKTGVRSEALAGAVTASGDDLSSININPSIPSRFKYIEAMFTQALLFEKARYSYFSYAHPSKFGTPFFDFMTLGYGEISSIDESGAKTGTLSPRDSSIGLGWSTRVQSLPFKDLNLGAMVRYTYSDYIEAKASAISFSFGGIYRTPIEGLETGFSVNHFGANLKYNEESEPLPGTIRAGISYLTKPFPKFSARTRFSLDGVAPNAGVSYFNGAAELLLFELLSVQIGYSGEEGLEDRVRYGFGIGFEAVQFNYGITPSGALGNNQQFSLRLRFGEKVWNIKNRFSKNAMIEHDFKNAQLYLRQGQYDQAALYANRMVKRGDVKGAGRKILESIETIQKKEIANQLHQDAVLLFQSAGREHEAFMKAKQSKEMDPENNEYQRTADMIQAAISKSESERALHTAKAAFSALESDFSDVNGSSEIEGEEIDNGIKLARNALANGYAEEALRQISKARNVLSVLVEKINMRQAGKTEQLPVTEKKQAKKVSDQKELSMVLAKKTNENSENMGIKEKHLINPESALDTNKEYEQGIKWLSQGRTEEAVQSFKKVLFINKSHRQAKEKIVNCLTDLALTGFNKNDYKTTELYAKEGLKYSPENNILKLLLQRSGSRPETRVTEKGQD